MPKPSIVALIAFALACALALLVAPTGASLDDATSGDAQLAERVRAAVGAGRGFQSLSVAEITEDSVTYAGVGSVTPGSDEAPQPQTIYELGSITKTFTGLALAQAVEDKTVSLDDRLDKHLTELQGSPAGGVTLGDLAAHRSGLPPMMPRQVVNMLAQWQFDASNVDGITEQQILSDAKAAQLTEPAEYDYSNFGATLTGLALARATGTTWPELIGTHVLQPNGMGSTVFAARPAEIPPMPDGYKANGRLSPHSCCDAQLPAGYGTMTSAEDIATYAQAMLDPDSAANLAMAPREKAGKSQIGLFWHITEVDGRQITWHNGGTGAFRTMLAVDREQGKAVLVMANTDRDVDDLGFSLLTGGSVEPPGLPTTGLVLLAIFALNAVVSLVQFWRAKQRKPVLGVVLWSAALALLTRALGPWQIVPGFVWAFVVGVAVAAVALGFSHLRDERANRSVLQKITGVFDVALSAIALVIGVALTIPWG